MGARTTLAAAMAAISSAALIVAPPASAARLPWAAHSRGFVTQDCNDSRFSDHVGTNGYAWDFAAPSPMQVTAPRAGTIVHVKMSSRRGGTDPADADAANYLVIDHGDGTYSVMLHLQHASLDVAAQCGQFVREGQPLARSGDTGWASGNHLHYQVNRVPSTMDRTCECGPDGMACGENEAHWDLFWSYRADGATIPVQFDEWPAAAACHERDEQHLSLESRNEDAREPLVPITATGQDPVSLGGRIPSPGLYELWVRPHGARNASEAGHVDLTAGSGHESIAIPNARGGGYQRLEGRFALSGTAEESVRLSGATGDVMLRRVGEIAEAPRTDRAIAAASIAHANTHVGGAPAVDSSPVPLAERAVGGGTAKPAYSAKAKVAVSR